MNLPPFPAVAARILQLVLKDDAGVNELAALIGADVAFSSEIMALANAAIFSFRTDITSLSQATLLLGFSRVKAIALTVGLRSYVRNFQTAGLVACWRHSLACGVAAEELAPACGLKAGEAYMAGLMHDMGRIGLAALDPRVYSTLLLEAQTRSINLLDRERELFGVDHCEAGRQLAEEWKLPAQFGDVAFHHHTAPKPGEFGIRGLIRVACRAANCIGFPAVPSVRPLELQEVLKEVPGSAAKPHALDADRLIAAVSTRMSSVE